MALGVRQNQNQSPAPTYTQIIPDDSQIFFKSESKKSGERVNDKKSWGGNKEAGAKTRLPERLAFDDSFRHKPMKQLHCSWAHCPLF